MKQQRKFDPYEVLGVPRDAAAEVIKRAVRAKAKETHPDVGGAPGEFDRVKRAQVILLDPKRRRKFDETGNADDPDIQSPDHGALTMISSLLAQILADGENDPLKYDLIEVIRNSLRADEKKEAQGLAAAERSLVRIAKMRKRFRRKAEGHNVFESMLTFSEIQLREMIAKQAHIKADRARALEILAEYNFEKDADQIVRQQFPTTGDLSAIFGSGIF
ncbi:MAG: DnaJ domain-containing protein [Xanthobacteraceae bacterium]|nr:DnaJ domain-containing protein [Xanthobacteraceae bacterium]